MPKVINDENPLKHPFGEVACEEEITVMGDKYSEYYFKHAPFNKGVLDKDCYLIVGRRGSGKTSLANYLTFQNKFKTTKNIYIQNPMEYEELAEKISRSVSFDAEVIVPRLIKLWEYYIWYKIFIEFKETHIDIKKACLLIEEKDNYLSLFKQIVKSVLHKYIDSDGMIYKKLENILSSQVTNDAKAIILKQAKKKPFFITIDSMERYDLKNHLLIYCIAAMIEFAKKFNLQYSDKGIHLKIFVSEEIYPELAETYVRNPAKYISNPIFLHWRPKDLLRLTCWRYFKYLQQNQIICEKLEDYEWDKYEIVRKKFWNIYFNENISNKMGLSESTFPYILRHTHMKPREVIAICNKIAYLSKANETFPKFSQCDIIKGMHDECDNLASSIINTYESIYHNVANIIDTLVKFPIIFEGKLLDKYAPRSSPDWPKGEYSPQNFRKLVAELGIVGRVRKHEGCWVEADFEYAMNDRLVIQPEDTCVIHPMFYRKLKIQVDKSIIVHPFPDEPEYEEIK
ncbi:hypothetical protein HZA73_03725 [candidate division TA06 bacterium]|nr:hypothetical protein [candidate division TA06 bacterium]